MPVLGISATYTEIPSPTSSVSPVSSGSSATGQIFPLGSRHARGLLGGVLRFVRTRLLKVGCRSLPRSGGEICAIGLAESGGEIFEGEILGGEGDR